MSKAAQEYIVERYKDLRADDAQGVGRNSYRITVRQLESMIRLSEAIARANCVNDISIDFVREAYNLLKQSIIHVEKDDVEMDDDDDEQEAPATEDQPPETQPVVRKEKTKVQYDKYVHMMNLIVRKLDEDERAGGQGIERDELIQWYLEQNEEEMNTEELLHQEAQLVRKVLKRLKKVSLMSFFADYRIITLWRFAEKQIWRMRCKLRELRQSCTCCILIVMLKISEEELQRIRRSRLNSTLSICVVFSRYFISILFDGVQALERPDPPPSAT